MDSKKKNFRVLDIYNRLYQGKIINKKKEAQRFGVDERSIQRDIDDIRAFLCENRDEITLHDREIIYERSKEGFVMKRNENPLMTNSEILAVSKILLESRAFTKEEIDKILDKMVKGCVPLQNMKLVSELLSNEKYHYVELHHKSPIQDKLWDLGTEIRKSNLLELVYQKQVYNHDVVTRIVKPVAILFSEYYFYLHAYIVEKNDSGRWAKKYDYPAIFRLDRIESFHEIEEKFVIPYADRFEEGEFRKRIQFMFSGELTELTIRYTGTSVEAILDRLPTAVVISQDETGYVIKAEVFGKGILMWLLGQGKYVEVLKPESVRAEIKQLLQEMFEKY